MPPDLPDYYRALRPHVIQLHVRWNQFLRLYTVSDARMQLLSRSASGFFGVIRDIIRDDAFISLSRLTDKTVVAGRENLCFQGLADAVDATVGGELSQSVRSLLDKLLAKVSGMRLYRNRLLAHIDLQRALQYDPPPLAKVQRGDIDEALSLTRDIMNAVAAHLGESPTFYEDVIVSGDADSLVGVLERVGL
jgi:hypothetical protein